MGDVYRADDLKLGQPVALKFLPRGVEHDQERLRRLLDEVRIARQISHPNVCRVYDIGEIDGHHYLSMEFVDGEDLASLLRRIGRLPRDKAVQISRQLCAGLAAAHEEGILHRDLKPPNVMIDGRGRVRLTDFGLAALANRLRQGEVRAGTPFYMAPEQLAGREVTVRSEIYSLGLVLYEMFTGKPVLRVSSLPELIRAHESLSVTPPSSLVKELDPAVERVILRCLAKDPRDRPSSALAVAAALPGGDPLAAALAAGETPSPEMVAAAGGEGTLGRGAAWALLGASLATGAAAAIVGGSLMLFSAAPLEKPPDVLADKAREVLARVGQTTQVVDEDWGFEEDPDYSRWVARSDPSRSSRVSFQMGRPAIFFWYRSSPRHLVSTGPSWGVTRSEPPATLSGMATVALDTRGRLIALDVVPPRTEESKTPPPGPDWSALFVEAGLDPTDFRETDPVWVPTGHADARAAWTGADPDRPDVPIRVEAAAFRGRPVFFRIVGPWTTPEPTRRDRPAAIIFSVFNLAALVGGALLARHNLHLGRGDRPGAMRVALFFLVTHLAVWLTLSHHVPTVNDELTLFQRDAGATLYSAGLLWLLYVALEPYVRRKWPDTIVAWSRLLSGKIHDPLVGRDVLLGAAFGAGLFLSVLLAKSAGWLEWLPGPPGYNLTSLLGTRWALGQVLDRIVHSVVDLMIVLFVLLILRLVLRKTWIAATVLGATFSVVNAPAADGSPFGLIVVVAMSALVPLILIRFGLLATVSWGVVYTILTTSPIQIGVPSWAGSAAAVPLLACAALAIYGFRTALAGRPAFAGKLLEE